MSSGVNYFKVPLIVWDSHWTQVPLHPSLISTSPLGQTGWHTWMVLILFKAPWWLIQQPSPNSEPFLWPWPWTQQSTSHSSSEDIVKILFFSTYLSFVGNLGHLTTRAVLPIPIRECSIFLSPTMVWLPVLMCAQLLMHAIAHRAVQTL